MKTLKNKIAAISIALFFIISMTASMALIPSGSAHTPPYNIPTQAYVAVAPATVGVGQYCTIVVWLAQLSPTAGGIGGLYFSGFKISIVEPNGNNVTIGPFMCASATSSDFRTFTPTMAGTYTIQFSFAGETMSNGTGPPGVDVNAPLLNGLIYDGDWFEPSISAPVTLTVQQQPVSSWPEPPLPTGYWTVPINAMNRGWSSLASNWLGGTWLINNNQEGTGPLSAHVLWTEPIEPGYPGGISDARWAGIPSDINDYEGPWSAPIIMNGVIYYNTPWVADSQSYGYWARSLYTGQVLYYKNGTDNGSPQPPIYNYIMVSSASTGGGFGQRHYIQLTQGQMVYIWDVNGQGVASYLIEELNSTWYFLDPTTGNYICSIINVPGGTTYTDQSGAILKVNYNSATGLVTMWNTTQTIVPGGPSGSIQQQWKPMQGGVYNALDDDAAWTKFGANNLGQVAWTPAMVAARPGYSMNATTQKGLPGSLVNVLGTDDHVPEQLFGDYIPPSYSGNMLTPANDKDYFQVWLVDINYHVTGYSPNPTLPSSDNTNLGYGLTVVLDKTINVPIPGLNYTWTIGTEDFDSQTFTLFNSETAQFWVYSLTTGALLWGPTKSYSQMDYYGVSSFAYNGGLVVSSSYGGWISYYNITTGALLWTYNATASPYPYESAYGKDSTLSIVGTVAGTIVTYSTEHSPTKPLWRESYLRCINMTNGQLIWKLDDFGQGTSIADGYIVSSSQYDNLIYCVGKGPSATTICAPLSGIYGGSSFTVTGKVTDQSPGALAVSAAMGYGQNGVPCVSDASQEGFMEYLYEQQACPANMTGVPVVISVIDPNGNYVYLGTVTTNTNNGEYGLSVPTSALKAGPGQYEIVATYAGSNSYGSSSASTYLTYNPAPATPAPTAPPVTGLASTGTVELGIAAVIIVIVIIGIVLAILTQRKRP